MFQSVFRRIVLISAGLLSFAARSSAEEAYPMYKPFFPAREDGKYEFINPSDPKVIEAMTKLFPEWKKRYAVRSLEERLRYEAPARAGAEPQLNDSAAEQLQKSDVDRFVDWTSKRAQSLKMLHTQKVEEFTLSLGFGFSRMGPGPGAYFIELEPPRPLEVVKLDSSTSIEKVGPRVPLVDVEASSTASQTLSSYMPQRNELTAMHNDDVRNFAPPWSFGWVKSKTETVGFEPHAFRQFPQLPLDAARKAADVEPIQRAGDQPNVPRWKLTRLELVSLLKHETPRVYESEQLPNMEQLSSKNARTRELVPFESDGLQRLRKGEDLHTESTLNRIEMFGSIRANEQCLQCHEVPRGTLLGAFSYELRRDPPLAVEKALPSVQ